MTDAKHCNAKTKAGTLCKRPAGWGTSHVGEGRCKLHGGRSPRGAESPHYKHGRYSKYLSPSEQVDFAEFKARLGPQLDFEEELLIGLFRGYRQIAQGFQIPVVFKGETVMVDPDPRYILQCMDFATKCMERLRQAREGVTVNIRITSDQVRTLLEVVGRAIGKHVSSKAEREAVMGEIETAGVAALEALEGS